MFSRSRRFSLTLLLCTLAFASAPAAVIFKAGEKQNYTAPGEEQISGNAKELFQIGQEAEQKNNVSRAIHAYRSLVRRYPRDGLAPGAGFRSAELQEQAKDYSGAALAYRWIMEHYPTDSHFNPAVEAQFRIGETYLNGKKIKFLGITVVDALDRAVEIFAAIIRSAPFGKYTARAQFDIGLAREKQGANDAALQAYQAVVDKFPNEPVAVDAQYQIGYIWYTAAKTGTKDSAATEKARMAFEDFLYRYAHSEKAAQAKANLDSLQHKATATSYSIARYYDKQKYYRAACIYYNEVIRQQPGSAESEKSKKRLEQLRVRFGDAALQPLKSDPQPGKQKPGEESRTARGGGAPAMRGAANESAPLPASENSSSSGSSSDSSSSSGSSGADSGAASDSSASSGAAEQSSSAEASSSPTP